MMKLLILFTSNISRIQLAVCFYLLFLVHERSCQKCVFKRGDAELTEDDTNFGLTLDKVQDVAPVGKLVLQLLVENVKEIESFTTSGTSEIKFIEPNLTPASFQLNLSEDFPNYEEYETKDVISVTVTFTCTTGKRKIEFLLPIEDTNNHDPVFINGPYSYTLAMPFPMGIAIDLFGSISARDIDLQNNNISFSLNSSDPNTKGFRVAWLSTDSVDKKKHHATLISSTILNLVETIEFSLYATDVGIPSRSTSTSVKILIDKENSILKFTHPVYIADYSNLQPKEANGLALEFQEGDVALSSGIGGTVDYSFTENFGEYQENFKLMPSEDFSKVQLILVEPPESLFNKSFILFTLTAKKAGTEENTILHVSLPGHPREKLIENCDETDDDVEKIVLGILLAIVTIILIVNICRNFRSKR